MFSEINKKIKHCSFLIIFIFIILYQNNYQILNSLPMDNSQIGCVTEELRLKVPSQFKETWLENEKKIWEPWLSTKDGFLGRQLYWDSGKEEALILVNWENKKLWKSISIKEVDKIQQKFEANVKLTLGLNQNPFELIYEGELIKQG